MKNRAQLSVSRSALVSNFRIIGKKVPHLKLLPMIKANAYGHGAIFAAQALKQEKQLHGFGVATFAEAMQIRESLKNSRLPILVFSDCAPWTEEKLRACVKYQLQPVFSEILSLLTFQKQSGAKAISAHVEVNTGMNRLGIPIESLSLLRFTPTSVFTHLADADHPESSLTQLQISNYEKTIEWVRARYPHALLHFANSSTIWNQRKFPLLEQMQLARPGLSLYGIRPFEKAKEDGLKRVMTVRVPIINKIYLNEGDQVGYGGTYICTQKKGEWVAILGAGYADGIFRSLGNAGIAVYGAGSKKSSARHTFGQKLNFLGRVSMDLSAIEGTAAMKIGDLVTLWGNEIDPYEQSNYANTIPYELTTRLGAQGSVRIERIEE
jgi:alanine racemase